MGKKNKNKKRKVNPQNVEVAVEQQSIEQTKTVQTVKPKATKAVKATKKTKKERKGSSLFRKLKETGSELKKVSWPSFTNVLKKTGVVLVVVLFFSLILFGIDFGLSKLFEVLVP